MSQPLRVLSIDGGGIRGIIPARVLARIEAETGRPIAQCFDLVAGTSTGGILALGLTLQGPGGGARYRAAELAEMYEQRGPEIFHASLWHRIREVGNLAGPRYGCDGIERVLREFFGEARLKDALTDVLVTSYEIQRLRDAFFFRSRRARQDPRWDFPIRHVARATSAAPTYFEPARVDAVAGDQYPWYALVDGGVFANNPAMCAYAEARAAYPDREILLVSVGTGQATENISYASARHWGLVGWAKPALDVVFDGVSDTVDYQLRQCLPGAGRYFRFQITLDDAADALDDVSPGNLRLLRETADKLIQQHADDLKRLAQVLTQTGAPPVHA